MSTRKNVIQRGIVPVKTLSNCQKQYCKFSVQYYCSAREEFFN